MPENHERHKQNMELVCRQDSASENYVLPCFTSDTLCVNVGESYLRTVSASSFQNELLKDALNTQQTVSNATQDSLELSPKEAGDGQDSGVATFVHSDIDARINKQELDGEEEIVNGMHSVASIGKELSLLCRKKSFTVEEDHSGTSQEHCFLHQSGLNVSVVDQEAADIVYDTLRLMNEVLQFETEITERDRNTSESEIHDTQHTNLETSSIEKDLVQHTHCTRKDLTCSLLTKQGVSNIEAQNATENKDEMSSLLHNAPLIYPETSDIAIAISGTTASTTKRKTSRSLRDRPSLSDVETGITSDITPSDMIDNCHGNPSENSLNDANTRQFNIVVRTHPDGGWGWVVCLGAFLVQFIALGMQNTAGIVYTELVKELKSQRGATAWVGSLATGIMFFLGPLTTSLCERFGCRIVTICGGLICIAGLLLSSLVTSLLPLYLTYGMMFGSGTSLCYFPTIIVLSKYFKRRIAVVNGLVTAGSGVGTLVIGPVVQALFLRFGVANTFRIVAGIFSLVILCGATFRPVPAKYFQYNDKTNGGHAKRIFDWSIFRNKGYVIWIASLATFQLGYFVPFVHLVRHAEDLGVSPTDASFLIGYLSVASTVGRLFFGKMADLSCVNRVRMYQMGIFAIGLCSFFVTLATGYGGLTAYAVTFGFFEACFVLLIPLVTSDIVGPEKMSYALGSAFTVMAFPMFLGPPIAGWMYDIFGDYAGAFYSCGGISMLSASLMFLVPRQSPQSNQRLAKLLKMRKTNRHSEVMQVLFGCLWKEKHESRTSSNVQYSVIMTTERVESV